ncbi:hypothetical protein GE21DRAFT_1349822, partial [Neurospora crassa]
MDNGLMLVVAPSSFLGSKFLEVASFFFLLQVGRGCATVGRCLLRPPTVPSERRVLPLTTLEEDLRTREGATSYPGPPAV